MADFDVESMGLRDIQVKMAEQYRQMAEKIKEANTALEDCRLYWQMKHFETAMGYMAEAVQELKKAQTAMIGGKEA